MLVLFNQGHSLAIHSLQNWNIMTQIISNSAQSACQQQYHANRRIQEWEGKNLANQATPSQHLWITILLNPALQATYSPIYNAMTPHWHHSTIPSPDPERWAGTIGSPNLHSPPYRSLQNWSLQHIRLPIPLKPKLQATTSHQLHDSIPPHCHCRVPKMAIGSPSLHSIPIHSLQNWSLQHIPLPIPL